MLETFHAKGKTHFEDLIMQIEEIEFPFEINFFLQTPEKAFEGIPRRLLYFAT